MNKFFKFILIGAINTILCILIFFILNNFFEFNIFVSNFMSYIVVIPLSYILYKSYVFETSVVNKRKVSYLLCFTSAYLLNYLIILFASSYTNLSNELIHFSGMVGYTLFFYYLNNRFVFISKV